MIGAREEFRNPEKGRGSGMTIACSLLEGRTKEEKGREDGRKRKRNKDEHAL